MSYPTNEDVCNLALGLIGEWYITDINRESQVERLCRLHLPQVRRTLLRLHPWNFAIKRAKLKQSDLENVFGFEYRHALPADYLQTITMWSDVENVLKIDKFKIEGEAVVSDDVDVYLEYVSDEICTTTWNTDFLECVRYKLAIAISSSLGAGHNKAAQLNQELEQIILPRSLTNNAWEDQSAENNPLEQQLRDSNYLRRHNVSY
ncbi:hypothetical protein OAI07_01350 [Akkermansiaceae bacterium]|nr:hypothetical protein [Akkermansiaceae bacterium]